MAQRQFFMGVDIGGTFTDLVMVQDGRHKPFNAKTLTTPHDPVEGVMNAVRDAMAQGEALPQEVKRVVHATTLATNLILERKGARLGFVTTKGFGDMFHISKQYPSGIDRFNALYDRPEPLVEREMVIEIRERLNFRGEVLAPLDEHQAEAAIRQLAAAKPDAVAVCLVHSYVNPAHERRVGEMLRRVMPDVYIALSSEVWPEFQEYERASTTLISAYVGPMLADYLGRLEQELRKAAIGCTLQIMQSSGAVMPASMAARKAVYSVESGPAAGVIATAQLGLSIGRPNMISFDMGGTTAKVGLIQHGKPHITHDFAVGTGVSAQARASGEPIKIPVIDLAEVGAGGGSIAWIDPGGLLQVGPHSAGAAPGPACYGLGGLEPTVTDANVVLGYLNPDYFLGGKMKIFPERSRESIARNIGERLNLDPVLAAHGIYQLANIHMGGAVRLITVSRGIDPREYAVMAFGGAGPIHIVKVAEQFNIPTVIVPPSPGVASAYGLLMSDLAHDNVTTHIVQGKDARADDLRRLFDGLERAGREALVNEGLSEKDLLVQRSIETRFVHQKHEISIPVPAGPITDETAGLIEGAFRDLYFELFKVRPADPVEFVNFAVRVVGVANKPQILPTPRGDGQAARALKGRRQAYFAEASGFVETQVYDRTALQHGDTIGGPAILEEPDSTTICPPGYKIEVDPFLNLVITKA
jgi:N-methylhydantoinase A